MVPAKAGRIPLPAGVRDKGKDPEEGL